MKKTLIKELEEIKDLNKTPTKYILSLFKRIRNERINLMCSCCNEFHSEEDSKLWYKKYQPWQEKLKEILDLREHIETNKLINKKVRQMCSKTGISKEIALKKIKER